MIEMLLLESTKETERKLRWGKEIGDTIFSLYVPKWRVPKPWPSKIYVDINPVESPRIIRQYHTRAKIESNKELKKKPIISVIQSVVEHTKTLRYQPLGDQRDWEVGEPYIPYELTYDSAKYLKLAIRWVK